MFRAFAFGIPLGNDSCGASARARWGPAVLLFRPGASTPAADEFRLAFVASDRAGRYQPVLVVPAIGRLPRQFIFMALQASSAQQSVLLEW